MEDKKLKARVEMERMMVERITRTLEMQIIVYESSFGERLFGLDGQTY